MAQFKSVWTMGELYVLPWELREERGLCGCGNKVRECEFWSPIIRKLQSSLSVEGKISLFREGYSIAPFFRTRDLMEIIFSKKGPKEPDLSMFCSENTLLFSEVRKRAESFEANRILYLVDSSKIFYRLYWLIHCSGIDLKVIHIVKDPRAFVYSKIKTEERTTSNALTAFRMSVRYNLENHLIERVIRRVKNENVFRIRYEQLAARPEKVLEQIGDWLKIPYPTHAAAALRSSENHGIAGNIMRHRSEGVFLDEKWKSGLSRSLKRLVILFTYFFAKKYHYLEKISKAEQPGF
jgi:hypothetical protein